MEQGFPMCFQSVTEEQMHDFFNVKFCNKSGFNLTILTQEEKKGLVREN